MRHAERVLQPTEAFAEWRHREDQAGRLLLVPSRADAEPGPTAREHVQRGVRLDPEAGWPVVDAADHQPDAGLLRVRRHEAERGHAIQHRRLWRPEATDLEEVVHDPDRVEANLIGGACDARQGWTDGCGPTRPGERVDLQAELHRATAMPFPPRSG